MATESTEIQVSNANNAFANNLYNALAMKDPTKDVFFSPLSVHALLSLVYQGAGSTTKDALASTLQLPNQDLAAEGYNNIMNHLNNVENVTLHIANKVYLKKDFELQEEFEDVATKKFLAGVENIDFEQNVAAANKINGWVNDQTHGKIPTLFESDDFDENTRLVLLNAIYFKGTWTDKFHKEATRTEPFFINENDKVDCQMMHRTGGFNYKNDKELDAKVLELPFTNQGISLIVALPNDKNGIADLESKVQQLGINKITSDLHWNSDVIVALPKFKLETKIDLKDPLTEIGLGELFDDQRSDLGNMIEGGERLYVSKAIQKAFIEVNEEGAEAAAATGFGIVPLSEPVYDVFYVNHPFIIILKDTNSALFYGKIMKPVSGDSNIAPRAEPTDKAPNVYYFRN